MEHAQVATNPRRRLVYRSEDYFADDNVASAPWAIAFAALAGTCTAGGAISLLDASDGWQQTLTTIYTWRKSMLGCSGPWSVTGYGDEFVTVVALAAIVLLGVAGATALRASRPRRLGQTAALLAIIPIGLLWFDSFIVGDSPAGDCDSIGLGGAASVMLTRAGWLLFAGGLFSLLTVEALGDPKRTSQYGSLTKRFFR
jgi:hypothetical protein